MKRIIYWILISVNAILALTLLFSYLAVHISPDDFVMPAYFGLAYPYLLLLNIVMVLIWTMLLRFEAFISLIIIVLGMNHFSNYLKLTKSKGNTQDTFRVLSYNIRLFNYYENNRVTGSEKKILDYIRTREPDIICLQEYFVMGDPAAQERSVKAILGRKYNSHIKLVKWKKDRSYGIATFSRFPVVRRGEIIHPGSSSLTIFTDVLIDKDTFRIYNNHLQSFRLKKMESSLLEEMTDDDNRNMAEVKSLSISLRNGFIKRSLQAQVVKDHIKRSAYPVIVAGDFNDTPVSYTYRKLRRGLNDSFVSSGYGAGFTYKGNYPPNRIDYILYDNNLTSKHFDILRVKYSDHYPVMAWFKKNTIRKEGS